MAECSGFRVFRFRVYLGYVGIIDGGKEIYRVVRAVACSGYNSFEPYAGFPKVQPWARRTTSMTANATQRVLFYNY